MIKYHDNTTVEQYGEDHTLLNNWDPERTDFGDGYIKVHFRINTKGYQFPNFSFEEKYRKSYETALNEVFSSIGWKTENAEPIKSCSVVYSNEDHSHLYLHPQEFSGVVRKDKIKYLAELFNQPREAFSLRWVDLYQSVYLMSDEEYYAYLDSKQEYIEQLIFELATTTKKNLFRSAYAVLHDTQHMVRLDRICDRNRCASEALTLKYIEEKFLKPMIKKGYLVEFQNENGEYFIRKINKQEQKERNLYIA